MNTVIEPSERTGLGYVQPDVDKKQQPVVPPIAPSVAQPVATTGAPSEIVALFVGAGERVAARQAAAIAAEARLEAERLAAQQARAQFD